MSDEFADLRRDRRSFQRFVSAVVRFVSVLDCQDRIVLQAGEPGQIGAIRAEDFDQRAEIMGFRIFKTAECNPSFSVFSIAG
jgi:hypothetical protein